MGAAFYATCWVGFWGGALAHDAIDSRAGFGSIGTGLIVGSVLGIIVAGFVMWWLIRRAVKTNYRVPAWTSWFGFIAALGGVLLCWIFHSHDIEVISFTLSICGIGLVFSLLGLGTPQRWTCAWGTGLGGGPIAAWLGIALTLRDWAPLAVPIVGTILGLVVALVLHIWVMESHVTSPEK